MLQTRYPIVLGQQRPCHIVLPRTSPAREPPMLSRAVLGGRGMCAWAAGPAAGAPSPAELPHDGCARRRGEPRVEQLPGNRLLSRPTLRPLSPSQGPFFFHSSSFLTGARPCVQVRNCSQCHQQHLPLGTWEPMAPGGEERGGSGRDGGEGGWCSVEAQPGCGKSCWGTETLLSLAVSCPSSPRLPQGSTQGQTSHS